MLEDLFKVVKFRAENDNRADKKNKVSIPRDLLFQCPRCGSSMFMDDFVGASKVCTSCGYHARLTAQERLDLTIDKGTFEEYDADMTSKNPIQFDGYEKKIADLQKKTGLRDAILTGECRIRNKHCVIAVMDSHFMMASMGSVVGEKLTRAFERATQKNLPVVVFAASGGARMQEGIVSLMQMAKTSAAVARHSDKGLLYITVLTDPTTGGVTASFASLGDIIIAEPKVLIGFAGRRVIEDTIRQRLPDDFQSAEFLMEHGFVDMIVPRKNLRRTISRLIRLHTREASR
ncbi:MAG: acetyl-CoA carboxylase, carboxyltransferase subunit beta [Oscillospiraceae bacterium]|nr:acetyl-CoA carboxylase, carboxyltransferase subunit beta [Oscillospiraceae bacterium]MDY3064579.1 acetyl-CoA carboxylase, carboxyltransferase subunit beta [Oscillospiraceae bacterium]